MVAQPRPVQSTIRILTLAALLAAAMVLVNAAADAGGRADSVIFVSNRLSSGRADYSFPFGQASSQIVTGDWDGNDIDGFGARDGKVVTKVDEQGTPQGAASYGKDTDTVFLTGDWNGNGVSGFAIVRGNVVYQRDRPTGGPASRVFGFGQAGDTYVSGDFDGDGVDTIGVQRGSMLYLRNSNDTGVADVLFSFGRPGDQVVFGDWDDNGTDTPAAKRGKLIFIRNSNTSGPAQQVISLGRPDDQLLAGDFNGTSTAALGAAGPGAGDTFAVRRATDGTTPPPPPPPRDPVADLSISKSDPVDPILQGSIVPYTVTVTNNGPDTAKKVVVTDTLPSGVTFVKSFGCNNQGSTCRLGALRSGETVTFSIFGQVASGAVGTITNRVSVSSDTADPRQGNNRARVDTTVIQRAPSVTTTRATVGVVDQDTGLWYLVDPIFGLMSGDQEVPSGSGDPFGFGGAQITANELDSRVCFDLELINFQGNVTAAHIHEGQSGTNGPVVLDLDWPNNGDSGCLDADADLIDQILADLDAYYVNVHTDQFPAGAMRGQLGGGPKPLFFFGDPTDNPFLGDWDGDGLDTVGVHRPSDGKVSLRNSNAAGIADVEFFFGNPDDVPLIGDWDGDGDDTIGLYRPSNNRVFIFNQLGSNGERIQPDFSFTFGNPGDSIFAGDFDGDGDDTIGLRRGRRFFWRNSLSSGPFDNSGLRFGDFDDEPLFGDWDGDGVETPGLFRPETSTLFLRNLREPGIADMEIFADGLESGDVSAWSR